MVRWGRDLGARSYIPSRISLHGGVNSERLFIQGARRATVGSRFLAETRDRPPSSLSLTLSLSSLFGDLGSRQLFKLVPSRSAPYILQHGSDARSAEVTSVPPAKGRLITEKLFALWYSWTHTRASARGACVRASSVPAGFGSVCSRTRAPRYSRSFCATIVPPSHAVMQSSRLYRAALRTSRHKIASRPFSLSRELYHRYRDRGVPSAEEIDRDERAVPLSAMFPDVPKTPHRNFKRDLRSVESRATRFSRKLIILACDRQLISTSVRTN